MGVIHDRVLIVNDSGDPVASGTADSGSPIKVGGVFNTNGISPTLSTGQRGDLQIDSSGNLAVRIIGQLGNMVDGEANTALFAGDLTRTNARPFANYNYIFNGTTWDRQRGSADAGQIVRPYAFPASDWSFASAAGGIVNNTAVTIKAAAGVGVRNYITCIDVLNTHATVATEFAIRDGAAGTVIWRTNLPAASVGGRVLIDFPTPLKSTANTLLEVIALTTGAAVFFNAQGYTAA